MAISSEQLGIEQGIHSDRRIQEAPLPIKHPVAPRFLNPAIRARAKAIVLFPELIGLVLRSYRAKAGMRQVDLAGELQWPQPKISRIERGDSAISVEQLVAIVDVMNVKLPGKGEEPIAHWDVLAKAQRLAEELELLDYATTWCTGPEWPGPEVPVRGEQLQAAIALAHVPFSE
jgi:transcriptional regulator with XRE-family HTH domain